MNSYALICPTTKASVLIDPGADGVKETWRDVAQLVGGQLERRFGAAVTVRYYDLFDPDCPPLPAEAQLPVTLINGELFSSGGIISAPRIRRYLEAS
jgi:hypothetical protein